MKPSEYNRCIPKEKFAFVNENEKMHDKELATKPISYFRDAFNRFKRNKASITATVIIVFLVLFAVIVPFVTPYKVTDEDARYKQTLPRSNLFYNLGIPFWDGCKEVNNNWRQYQYEKWIGEETGLYVIKNNKVTEYDAIDMRGKEVTYYKYRRDSYYSVGVVFLDNITEEEFKNIQKYQDETGIQVIYPITEESKRPTSAKDNIDANFWYETNSDLTPVLDKDGNPIPIYKSYTGTDGYTSKVRVEGNEAKYDYAIQKQDTLQIRVCYYNYYVYVHQYKNHDKIKTPFHLFGADGSGKDILTCLASGARFSFILAIIVASINLFVGAIYGAIEGYYGGKIDLAMERFVEILSAVPFMIVISLLKYHLSDKTTGLLGLFAQNKQAVILFIAFFLTGWIGMAGRTRMQFYRFKNQEYVLAARTLGAKDARVMFKHIFPNSLGTLITSCVLVIPSVIFSETSLSYLGIINLNTGKMTSVGTLLANGQGFLTTSPHIVLFPSLFICLLMLSFNLFGNGLRDAFNPSLRGAED